MLHLSPGAAFSGLLAAAVLSSLLGYHATNVVAEFQPVEDRREIWIFLPYVHLLTRACLLSRNVGSWETVLSISKSCDVSTGYPTFC